MGELVRFPRHDGAALSALRPSAPVIVIPSIDFSSLKGADPQAAARALLPMLDRQDFNGAERWWSSHIERVSKRAKLIYTPGAVSRMVKGYSGATRAEIARLRAKGE